MVEVLNQVWRTARKPHRCTSCHGTIDRGDRYHVSTCVDVDLYQYKAHERCKRAAETVVAQGGFSFYDDLPNVSDFGDEDWETIRAAAPDLHAEFLARTSGYGPTVPDETQA